MLKSFLSIFVAAILINLLPDMAHCADAQIRHVSASQNTINQYELLEISATISASYKNPHDPAKIELVAHIKTPDDKDVIVPAFFTGNASAWKVHYTPTKIGRFSYSLALKTPSNTVNSPVYHFDVKPGTGDGFLRKGERNPFYPVFDSGKPFFGIGHNIGWAANNNAAIFDQYFTEFEKNGCNLTRIWINNPWALPFEDQKLGVYNHESCEQLDNLIQSAKAHGIYIILVLDTYASLMEGEGEFSESWWKTNPYNKANGGPCAKPWDFFTDKMAKQYYKDRLRYIISRWGYSPNILAFELWNETDAPEDWTKEMIDYIKSINPHNQLITTSVGYPWGNNFNEVEIFKLNKLDIIQRHIYGNLTGGTIENIISVNKEMSAKYNKMILVGEYGINANQSDKFCDITGTGVPLHNSIWACAMSRSFAGALNWWWAEYVKAKNLYPHYLALRNFVKDVNWNSERVEFAKASPVMQRIKASDEITYGNVKIPTQEVWGNILYREFTITNNGNILGGAVNAYLHGESQKDFKINPIFYVNYPVDGKFIIQVGIVSQHGILVVYLDDKEVLRRDFPTGPGEGPWQKCLYRKDKCVYQCVYNAAVEVNVPQGQHTIRLSNVGKDWIGIKKITLTNYKSSALADACTTGLIVDRETLLWIQNRAYDWKKAGEDIEPATLTDLSFTVEDVDNGTYNIEWWDTFEGKAISSQKVTATNRSLPVNIPPFSKDIACKIKKVKAD